MKHRNAGGRKAADLGPSQRQLRAGELVRHSLAEILRDEEIQDPALAGVSITVTEVRMSPDFKHAMCFVEPLGAGVRVVDAAAVVEGLNRAAKFLRGRLGHSIELRSIPALKFVHDESFDAASKMDALFAKPEVARDLAPLPLDGGGVGGEGERAADEGNGAGDAADAASSDISGSHGASTPIPDPSPIEGEGG